jgi:hypothetical protein
MLDECGAFDQVKIGMENVKGGNLSHCYFGNKKIAYGFTWNRTQAAAVGS